MHLYRAKCIPAVSRFLQVSMAQLATWRVSSPTCNVCGHPRGDEPDPIVEDVFDDFDESYPSSATAVATESARVHTASWMAWGRQRMIDRA